MSDVIEVAGLACLTVAAYLIAGALFGQRIGVGASFAFGGLSLLLVGWVMEGPIGKLVAGLLARRSARKAARRSRRAAERRAAA